ncbi:MAG TPA: DNA polymerase III subunit gamma/tau, partial [Sedimentisphaerales bacterium]|nr:DNA polymerase III subunit gamma/tau [Sedimentisphaerales bacterium]
MAYTVLARKYRSQTFDEVVGQEPISKTLKNAIETGRVAHAYLFTGTRGVGKTTLARILAKALNCLEAKEPTTTPCLRCSSCLAINTGEDIDVIEIDGASNNRVDEIRELRENAVYRPARARYKIYIIDEVHMLTTAAFNALLKTLEEPPEHVKFIFATTEPNKVIATIQSRCQRF